MLYYQFLKHAFGLRYANEGAEVVYVRLNLDQLPQNRKENTRFKSFRLNDKHRPGWAEEHERRAEQTETTRHFAWDSFLDPSYNSFSQRPLPR